MASREIEITADQIDCDLYRVICRVENLYDSLKRYDGPKVTELHSGSARVADRARPCACIATRSSASYWG